jgi:uncharacterized membrane protein YqjE
MSQSEPRNPLYLLLLLVGVCFVATALAVAVLPILEDRARDAGQPLAPSPFRDAVRANGWRWLLAEVAALVVLGVASMVWDRLRSLKKERNEATIPPQESEPDEHEPSG